MTNVTPSANSSVRPNAQAVAKFAKKALAAVQGGNGGFAQGVQVKQPAIDTPSLMEPVNTIFRRFAPSSSWSGPIQDHPGIQDGILEKYEKQREEQYGPEMGNLTEEAIEQLKSDYEDALINGTVEEKEVEHGVKETKFGDWTQTEITLYGGKKFSELSEEEQAKVLEYEAEVEKWNSLTDEEKEFLKAPKCPEGLEESTEVRVKHADGELETIPNEDDPFEIPSNPWGIGGGFNEPTHLPGIGWEKPAKDYELYANELLEAHREANEIARDGNFSERYTVEDVELN